MRLLNIFYPSLRTEGEAISTVTSSEQAPQSQEIAASQQVVSRNDGHGYIQISFSDTGKGIPQEYLNKIFDPFFTTKEPGKGTGLGLSVSQSIIENHGGKIFVESTVSKGATFTIRLPIV